MTPEDQSSEEFDEDETFGCGYSYDHTEEFIDEADGIVMLRCTNCDAEWTEDGDDEE